MRLTSKSNVRADGGSAVIEFVFFGCFISISLLVGGLILTQSQHNQLISTAAARQLARELVHSGKAEYAGLSLPALASSFEIEARELKVSVRCEPECAGGEISPAALIKVTVTYRDSSSSSIMRALRQ